MDRFRRGGGTAPTPATASSAKPPPGIGSSPNDNGRTSDAAAAAAAGAPKSSTQQPRVSLGPSSTFLTGRAGRSSPAASSLPAVFTEPSGFFKEGVKSVNNQMTSAALSTPEITTRAHTSTNSGPINNDKRSANERNISTPSKNGFFHQRLPFTDRAGSPAIIGSTNDHRGSSSMSISSEPPPSINDARISAASGRGAAAATEPPAPSSRSPFRFSSSSSSSKLSLSPRRDNKTTTASTAAAITKQNNSERSLPAENSANDSVCGRGAEKEHEADDSMQISDAPPPGVESIQRHHRQGGCSGGAGMKGMGDGGSNSGKGMPARRDPDRRHDNNTGSGDGGDGRDPSWATALGTERPSTPAQHPSGQRRSAPTKPSVVSGHGGPARSSDGARFKPNTKTLLSGGGGTPPAASSSPQLDTIMEDHDPFDELWAAEDASFANASASIQKLSRRQLSIRESVARTHARLLQSDAGAKLLADAEGLMAASDDLLADLSLEGEEAPSHDPPQQQNQLQQQDLSAKHSPISAHGTTSVLHTSRAPTDQPRPKVSSTTNLSGSKDAMDTTD